jgi:hypothetical protein
VIGPDLTAAPAHIQFALISHTNNGKTTLARTLLGSDVGEVRDSAHVTLSSEAHTLLATQEGDLLQLWDTPGFGDSVRLFRRLSMSGNPIGWFLREVLDRFRDRPFWLSQQAMRTAKDSADIVLYLVNSSEEPRDTGYLPAEMRILAWLEKPVVVLLNQIGPPRPATEEQAERLRWREHLAQYPIVREVLALDAFARCWVHERVFFETVGGLVRADQSAGYARLLAVWEANNARRFEQAMRLIAQHLLAAAADQETVNTEGATLVQSALKMAGIGKAGERKRQDKAMKALVERLDAGIAEMTRQLLILHKIDPSEASRINARVRDNFVVQAPVDRAQAGLLGAVLSGAATGLSADLMAGGLTFGGGAVLGGIVGALTFAGAAWGFNVTAKREQPVMQFSDAFLGTLTATSMLRYLAVIHFGRGRGNFVESEAPAFWQTHVADVMTSNAAEFNQLWADARAGPVDAKEIEDRLAGMVNAILRRLYPDSLH